MGSSNGEQSVIPSSKILIADSDAATRRAYARALEQEGHVVTEVASAQAAFEMLASLEPDLMLLAYSLIRTSEHTVVMELKRAHSRMRVVLLMEQDDAADRRRLLRELPIQGLHEKAEGADKLFVWVDVVLKSLSKLDMIRTQLGTIKSQIKIIEKNKEGLRYIISAMPETVNRLQPLDKFIRGVLIQLNSFLDAENSFLATVDDNGRMVLLVGTGEYDVDEKQFMTLPSVEPHRAALERVRASRDAEMTGSSVYVPLNAKDRVIGLFHLAKKEGVLKDLEIEMVRLFASQVAVTIENSNLFTLATIDALTGLYVRRYFLQRFQETLQLSSRLGGQALSLLIFDIDHFKRINDTYGHPEGDKVLAKVGELIRDSIRATDIAGRLGGEEFGVVLLDADRVQAQSLADAIRKKVEACEFIIGGERRTVTISVGGSSFPVYMVPATRLKERPLSEATMSDVRKMLAASDKALYASKENGRNKVTLSNDLSVTE